jgi:hypothetical protein
MVLLVAAVALACGGVSEAKRTSACERLRGADLAPARTIKLVRRDNEDRGTDLVGCELPRGRLRTFASSAGLEKTRRSYDIVQIAGAFVLLRSQYASHQVNMATVSVRNVRSADSYEIAHLCAQAGNDCGRGGRSSSALSAFINERGQGAAALIFARSGATTISGFSPLGERRDYDSGLRADIPAGTLKLVGDRASWSNRGRTYSAQLPE